MRGGDRHSQRIEAVAPLILALAAGKDDGTLMEVHDKLARQGHRFGIAIRCGSVKLVSEPQRM